MFWVLSQIKIPLQENTKELERLEYEDEHKLQKMMNASLLC